MLGAVRARRLRKLLLQVGEHVQCDEVDRRHHVEGRGGGSVRLGALTGVCDHNEQHDHAWSIQARVRPPAGEGRLWIRDTNMAMRSGPRRTTSTRALNAAVTCKARAHENVGGLKTERNPNPKPETLSPEQEVRLGARNRELTYLPISKLNLIADCSSNE